MSQEKKIIIESIVSRLKVSENKDYLKKKNRKVSNKGLLFKVGNLLILSFVVINYYLNNESDTGWIFPSIAITIGLIVVIYRILNYSSCSVGVALSDADA